MESIEAEPHFRNRPKPAAGEPPPLPSRTCRRRSYADFFESLLVTILLALFGTTFIVQAFKIPSQSMEPTLLVGDHLLVNKFVFGGHRRLVRKASALPAGPPRRHHRLQVSLRRSSALRQTRHRLARRSHSHRQPAGLRQRQSLCGALRRPRSCGRRSLRRQFPAADRRFSQMRLAP